MSTASCYCGAVWSGHRIEHCTLCHETFTGAESGDKHRIGPHWPPGQRRCRTVAEMEKLGMTRNSRGQWTTGRVDPRHAVVSVSDDDDAGGYLGTPEDVRASEETTGI